MWGIEAKRPKYRQDERRLLLVPVGDILPNPDQPRREFAYDKLLELAQSIDENGLLNPVTVTLRGDKPVLVAGERRLRAAKIAGLREIPCLVVEADGERSALMALVENLQRGDSAPDPGLWPNPGGSIEQAGLCAVHRGQQAAPAPFEQRATGQDYRSGTFGAARPCPAPFGR